MQCTYKLNIEARSCNHCCSGKAINIPQFVGVCVALVIEHAMRMRHVPKHFPLYFVLRHPQSILIRLLKTIHILGFVSLIFLDFQAGYCLLFTNHGNV